MDPVSKYTVSRNILQIEETYRAAVVKAEQEKNAALRQLIDKMLATEIVVTGEEKV